MAKLSNLQKKYPYLTNSNFKKHKRDIGRTVKSSKIFKSSKHGTAKQRSEHELSVAFSDSIEQSRERIHESIAASYDAVYMSLSERLMSTDEFYAQQEQETANIAEELAIPFKNELLEWTSADGKQTGTVVLGSRMKKFQKTIDTEEKEIIRQYNEWLEVQNEIDNLVVDVAGLGLQDQTAANNLDTVNYLNTDQMQMKEEIEAEKARFYEMMDQAAKHAVRAMTDSEKELKLKQKKVEDQFMALLREDEY